MIRIIVAMALSAMAGVASAQGMAGGSSTTQAAEGQAPAPALRKPCEDLKAEIDAKIKKNGVPMYSLDVVEMDAQAEGKIVGTCDGNTRKIVYKRS
jgi:Protein of unknown function (DUF1161)